MQWFCRATCLSSSFHKQLWDNNTELFYRDGSYVGKGVFWARANGWAITAMVNAIRFAKNPAHLKVYTEIFKQLAIELASLQGADGAWRASLLNATGFPSPETTGTANFVYSMAYGVRVGLLDSTTYLPVVEKGWQWLSTTALQPSGLVGYCKPRADPSNRDLKLLRRAIPPGGSRGVEAGRVVQGTPCPSERRCTAFCLPDLWNFPSFGNTSVSSRVKRYRFLPSGVVAIEPACTRAPFFLAQRWFDCWA